MQTSSYIICVIYRVQNHPSSSKHLILYKIQIQINTKEKYIIDTMNFVRYFIIHYNTERAESLTSVLLALLARWEFHYQDLSLSSSYLSNFTLHKVSINERSLSRTMSDSGPTHLHLTHQPHASSKFRLCFLWLWWTARYMLV